MTSTRQRQTDPIAHQPRTYRNRLRADGLVRFRVVVKETDLLIHADTLLEEAARELVIGLRHQLEAFIASQPAFGTALTPWPVSGATPLLAREMAAASRKAGVGPMAAVAGAIAEGVGRGLLAYSRQVVVENGGDVFLKTDTPAVVGIYAADSPLSLRIGLRVDTCRGPVGVCTSSGTVGHSLSYGQADAVCVLSSDCPGADAAATAIGNRVGGPEDMPAAVAFGREIDGVSGLLIIVGEKMGLWGDLEVVPLQGKKG